MSGLRDYLQQMADNWAKLGAPAVLERFVLRNGKEYEGQKLPDGFDYGTPKECFRNSAMLANQVPGLRYVEGFMLRDGLPLAILHAWCVDADDQVIDVTLKDSERCQYMGVAVSPKEVWKELRKSGVYGLLDHGLGLNVKWMFKRDPGLKDEVEEAMANGMMFRSLMRGAA